MMNAVGWVVQETVTRRANTLFPTERRRAIPGEAMPVRPLEPGDPERLGRFGRLGEGGQGIVYLGRGTGPGGGSGGPSPPDRPDGPPAFTVDGAPFADQPTHLSSPSGPAPGAGTAAPAAFDPRTGLVPELPGSIRPGPALPSPRRSRRGLALAAGSAAAVVVLAVAGVLLLNRGPASERHGDPGRHRRSGRRVQEPHHVHHDGGRDDGAGERGRRLCQYPHPD